MTNAIITNIFLSVWEVCVPVSLIAAVLLLMGPYLHKRYAAKWKYRIWIFLALCLLFPLRKVWAVADVLPQMLLQHTVGAEAVMTQTLVVQKAPYRMITVGIPPQMTVPVTVQPESGGFHFQMTVLEMAALIWLAGFLGFLMVHLAAYLHAKRKVRKQGTQMQEEEIWSTFLSLKDELQIRRILPVMYLKQATGPMVIGFFHPLLVLPEQEYSSKEIYFILKHELIHFKRKDVFIKLLFTAANAVCWFDPLIWLMVKEAAVDMEISCDDCVVQGAGKETRKAYTEALLSVMHRQYQIKTALSTHFYGGKKVMKKRFESILSRSEKKNGRAVFTICVLAAVLPVTVAGCTISDAPVQKKVQESSTNMQQKKTSENHPESSSLQNLLEQMAGIWRIDTERTDLTEWGTGTSYGNEMEITTSGDFRYYIGIGVGGTGQCRLDNQTITVEIQPYEVHSSEKEILILQHAKEYNTDQICMTWHGQDIWWKRYLPADADPSAAEDLPAADTDLPAVNVDPEEGRKMLTFIKEGLAEKKRAWLAVGDGFSIYLTDGEWEQTGAQEWKAVANDQVWIWISHFEDRSSDEVLQQLIADGYQEENGRLKKQNGDIINYAALKKSDEDLWGIFYCYPSEAEEGWGRELPVIADTFALQPASVPQSFSQQDNQSGAPLSMEDQREIQNVITEFAGFYFQKDADSLKRYLSESFDGDITVYEGSGIASHFTIKGLYAMDEKRLKEGNYIISLEFRDSAQADSFWYLTFGFVRQEDGWKIQWYGLEA